MLQWAKVLSMFLIIVAWRVLNMLTNHRRLLRLQRQGVRQLRSLSRHWPSGQVRIPLANIAPPAIRASSPAWMWNAPCVSSMSMG